MIAEPVCRKTLNTLAVFKGNGIHTNAETVLTLLPTEIGTGIRARRIGKPGFVPIDFRHASAEKSIRRTVVLGPEPENLVFEQLEHVMAALCAAGVTDAIIELGGPEPPFLGGGSKEFLQGILRAGVDESGVELEPLVIQSPMAFEYGGAHLVATPHEGFRLSCFVDFPGTVVGSAGYSMEVTQESFAEEVAAARTFALKRDIDALWAAGLARGGNLQNAVVFDEKGYSNDRLYFEDEVPRHKIIDFLGDLALLGRPLRGHFWAWKAGHQSHVAFAQKLARKYGLS